MKNRLIKALEKCAEAHHVHRASDKTSVTLMSATVPVLADVGLISIAFFGTRAPVHSDGFWGYTTISLDECPFLDEVNEEYLKMALPYGTKV